MLARLGCTLDTLQRALAQLGFQSMSRRRPSRRPRRPRSRDGNKRTSAHGEPELAVQSRAARRSSG
jgi:hypothetical protein